jgi:hypothetical protein
MALLASRIASTAAVCALSFLACSDERSPPAGSRKVQAFTFAGADLVVVEASTTHSIPRGQPSSSEDADGRVVRYAGGALGEPQVLLEGLTLQPAQNSAVAVIANRAVMRTGCQIWLFGLDDGARELIPCDGALQWSAGDWLSDGAAIYTDMKTANTSGQEGTYYIGKVDVDGHPTSLPSRVFGEDFAIDGRSLYLASACPRLEAICPEAGVDRVTLADLAITRVAGLDPARTSVDLAQRKIDRVALGAGRIYFTTSTSWSKPTCAVHVTTIGADLSAKDLFVTDDGRCAIAATGSGVVVCGDNEVVHVDAATGSVEKLAMTNRCRLLQWRDGLAAWLDADALLRTARTP